MSICRHGTIMGLVPKRLLHVSTRTVASVSPVSEQGLPLERTLSPDAKTKVGSYWVEVICGAKGQPQLIRLRANDSKGCIGRQVRHAPIDCF